MTSPDDLNELEQRLTRALRAHGDSVEASPDAYGRLLRTLDEARSRPRRIRRILARTAGHHPPASTASWRPLGFVAALLLVAGVGVYSLFRLASSPAETATAAPATGDVSALVPGPDESSDDGEAASIATAGSDTAESDGPMADTADSSPRSSVPSDPASNETPTATAGDAVERYAGLTYAPVRLTALEAAQAFLDLLAVDDVQLEQRTDQVIVRAADDSVLTTLSIDVIGDGFMVVEARSDRIGLSIDNAEAGDPMEDDIVDAAVATGSLQLTGAVDDPSPVITIAVRSVIDGSVLVSTATSTGTTVDDGVGYRATVPITGTERVWVVAMTESAGEVRSLAARPVLHVGRADTAGYTVVGIPPDDADGGLMVRSTPSGEPVGVIESGSTGVRRLPVPPRVVDGTIWWAVADPTGLEGWAAARYLAIDDTPAETTMVELARSVIAAVTDGDGAAVEAIGVSTPVFIGSVVDPRPIRGPVDVGALLTTRRRLAAVTLADFYGFDRWADAEVFVPTGYRQEGAGEGASAYFGDLPSVVIRSLNPATGGWERVHLFVSRQGDRPTLVGMVLETEPLPESAPAAADPAATSPPITDG